METLILTRRDVADLLPVRACIASVEAAFGQLGRGEAAPPSTLAVHAHDGAFHIKAGMLRLGGRVYFAAKSNGNFPANPASRGLPTIQGVVLLSDAEDGRVLAIMDSLELTARRTAAATAVAAKHLMSHDAHIVTICGCGVQAVAQLAALREIMDVHTVFAYDTNAARAHAFADSSGGEAVTELRTATLQSDVVVTCTTSSEFLLYRADIKVGAFVAGVGVDSGTKKELAPELLAGAKVVTDSTHQCASIGDLHHALDAGLMTREDVHAELPAIVAGLARGRTNEDEAIVFDSTGIGIQDVAAAAAVYESALESGEQWLSIELAPSA
jgi:ornithine cyclodeaminase/alanine dehydrogenase-like protein (mu-crystallin family)